VLEFTACFCCNSCYYAIKSFEQIWGLEKWECVPCLWFVLAKFGDWGKGEKVQPEENETML